MPAALVYSLPCHRLTLLPPHPAPRRHPPSSRLLLQITPGKRSPTIAPLDDGEWMSVQVMVSLSTVADVMDQLEDAGATDILMFNIENCRHSTNEGIPDLRNSAHDSPRHAFADDK